MSPRESAANPKLPGAEDTVGGPADWRRESAANPQPQEQRRQLAEQGSERMKDFLRSVSPFTLHTLNEEE